MTARAGNENDVRKVTAVLTEQQYAWAQEVVLSGAMEGLTCSVSTVIRLALDRNVQRSPVDGALEQGGRIGVDGIHEDLGLQLVPREREPAVLQG